MNYKWAIFLVVLVCFLFLFITQAEPFVRSDGYYSYHTAKVVVENATFTTREKPEYWDVQPAWTKTVFNEKYVSVTSPGTALLIAPALLVSRIITPLISLDDSYFKLYNGHTLIDGICILLNTCIFFFLGIYFTYRSLRALNISEKISIISLILSTLASFILWYVLLYPSISHVYEFFSVALLLYSFVLYRKTEFSRYLVIFFLSSGILVLIRPIFIPMVLFAVIFLLYKNSKEKVLKNLGLGFAIAIPFMVLIAIYNLESYGSIFSSGYSITRGETFTLDTFNGLNLLFSTYRGWLIYSPLFIGSIIGLAWFFKKNKRVSILSLGSIVLGVVIYGFWPTWWGGGSFGSRFMLYTLPFCVLGLAVLLQNLKHLKIRYLIYIFLGIATLYSTSLMFLYRVTPINSDFYLPTDFFKRQVELINKSGSLGDYIKINMDSLQEGSGLVRLLAGQMDYMMQVSEVGDEFTYELTPPPYSRSSLFPMAVSGFIVNKLDKRVYQIDLEINSEGGTFALFEATKVFGIDSLPLGDFSGARVNSKYDFYLSNRTNIQLRGEVINWIPPLSVFPLFE